MSTEEISPQGIIVAKGLGKAFGLQPVLRNLTFSLPRGKTIALLGPNGSGKTTLLRLLSTLSNPTTGTLTIGGWTLPKEAAAVRANLGVVAHSPILYDDLSAAENLSFFARLYGLSNPQIEVALVRVGLAKRANDRVRTFSRGMQQRLALARAALHNPAIFLLDEPYTGLDVAGCELLDSLLAEWKTMGKSIIISLHEIDRAELLCDHALILNHGRLVADTSIDALHANAEHLPDLFLKVTA